MSLQIDGVEVDEVFLDGQTVEEVQIDGVTVWIRELINLSGIPAQIFSLVIKDNPGNPDAVAGYRISSDGTHRKYDVFLQGPLSPDWITKGVGADYHVRMRFISGDALDNDSSATDVWHSMASGFKEWTLTLALVGTESCNLELDVSNDGGATILETKSIGLNVNVESGA